MPDGTPISSGERLRGAQQHENITAKLANIRKTIAQVSNAPGVSAGQMDRAVELGVQVSDLTNRVTAEWKRLRAPFEEAEQERVRAQAAVVAAQQALQRAQRPGAASLPELFAGPAAQMKEKRLKEQEDKLAEASKGLELANAVLIRAQDLKVRAEVHLDAMLDAPNDVFDAARREVDSLMGLAQVLLKEAQAGRSLAEAGVEAVVVETTYLLEARDFHRRQARALFWAMVATAIVFVAGIAALLLPSDASAGRFWLLMTIRLSFAIAAGSLAAFFGKLHARHSQQAIWYQDRLAGLDASKLIIHHASPEGRERTLRAMIGTYLGLGANAFTAGDRSDLAMQRELRKLLKTVVKEAGGSTKGALAALGQGRAPKS